MKRGARIADAMRRGAGRAARVVGAWCDAYRAHGTGDPLAPANRFMKLQVAFAPPGAGARPPEYGAAGWWGVFDAAYTRAGDYLVRRESRPEAGDGGVWFIAAQEPMLPVLCVRATRVIDVARPPGATVSGVNSYGGVARTSAVPLLSQWPVSLLASGGLGIASADLPADVPAGSWQVLLPACGVTLLNGDLVSDDLGRSGVVTSAELTAMGWRLLVKQAKT